MAALCCFGMFGVFVRANWVSQWPEKEIENRSTFNAVFFLMVCYLLQEALGVNIQSMVEKSTHIGDDLSVILNVAGVPAMVAYGLAAMGCNLNGVKQYQSTVQVEILQRLVSAEGMFAFKNRAIGNLAAPPVQREVEGLMTRVLWSISVASVAPKLAVSQTEKPTLFKLQQGTERRGSCHLSNF